MRSRVFPFVFAYWEKKSFSPAENVCKKRVVRVREGKIVGEDVVVVVVVQEEAIPCPPTRRHARASGGYDLEKEGNDLDAIVTAVKSSRVER